MVSRILPVSLRGAQTWNADTDDETSDDFFEMVWHWRTYRKRLEAMKKGVGFGTVQRTHAL